MRPGSYWLLCVLHLKNVQQIHLADVSTWFNAMNMNLNFTFQNVNQFKMRLTLLPHNLAHCIHGNIILFHVTVTSSHKWRLLTFFKVFCWKKQHIDVPTHAHYIESGSAKGICCKVRLSRATHKEVSHKIHFSLWHVFSFHLFLTWA